MRESIGLWGWSPRVSGNDFPGIIATKVVKIGEREVEYLFFLVSFPKTGVSFLGIYGKETMISVEKFGDMEGKAYLCRRLTNMS